MRKYFLYPLAFVAVGACASPNDVNVFNVQQSNRNLAHKAYYWYGLHERKNRETIKAITGVDPVRTEWCAAFVNMVLLENGIPRSSSVSPYPLMARSFLAWGEEVETPKQGDIVVFERGESGWQGHVGFFVSEKIEDGQKWIYVLGGNQNDEVNVSRYPASKLLSVRRHVLQ